jgi:hypothetical protein
MHKTEFRSIQGRPGWRYVGGQHTIGPLYMLLSRCVQVKYCLLMRTCLPSVDRKYLNGGEEITSRWAVMTKSSEVLLLILPEERRVQNLVEKTCSIQRKHTRRATSCIPKYNMNRENEILVITNQQYRAMVRIRSHKNHVEQGFGLLQSFGQIIFQSSILASLGCNPKLRLADFDF